MATRTPHEWSSAAFLAKAQRYADQMLVQSRDDWQFGFWSALCLEMILRSAVSHTSPALLADGKEWGNLMHALGKKGPSAKVPKSVDSAEVISRAEFLCPAFTREHSNFCAVHFQRRNSELHTGSLPFDGLDTSSWLAQYYAACQALLSSQSAPLDQIFGEAESETATTLIQALKDDAAKGVKSIISAHRTIWDAKASDEQRKLASLAEAWAQRSVGHRATCPACSSVSLVYGNPAGPESSSFEDGLMVLRRPMLPSGFECRACDLKISDHSRLSACGLGGPFTSTSYAQPVDYFVNDFQENFSGPDDDNNEP